MNRLSSTYRFEKPNDKRALDLMNAAAAAVMKEIPDIRIAFGVSDEYRFVANFRELQPLAADQTDLVSFLIARASFLTVAKGWSDAYS